MNNRELNTILQKIIADTGMDLKQIAIKSNINRSHLSSFINNEEEIKTVTNKMLAKLKIAFPAYFDKHAKSNTNQQSEGVVSAREFIDYLIKSNEEKQKLLESFGPNLNSLLSGQTELIAFVRAAVEWEVDRYSNKDQEAAKVEMDRINKFAYKNLVGLKIGIGDHNQGKG